MSEQAVVLEGVTKTFGDKRAVDALDLAIPAGSVCGYLGPNGAGKTTTIRMIMSIIYPDSGRIEVLGRASAIESKDRIGYLPEERGVYRKMKVGDFLAYIARLKGAAAGAALTKRIDGWLERVQLADVRKKKCEQLSKGMQQKVQFLATVIHDPDLVILDEPFSGLDPVNARLLRTLIDEMRDAGKTIIFSTHVLGSAEQLCDRVFMINRGKKVLDGPIDAIRAKFDPKTIVVEPADTAANGAFSGSLGALPGVKSVMRLGDRSAVYEAHLEDGTDPQGVIGAIATGLPVRRVELRKATLEDIFVSLVDPGDSEDSIRAALKAESAEPVGA
ncbi:MAG: ATP-binding cassette domain-containing protein [Planctomycetota bacterium]|nr:MAG: ATP-binding cassette domain-containing protein [Planctomycetota bacterium]